MSFSCLDETCSCETCGQFCSCRCNGPGGICRAENYNLNEDGE